jgi:hypothetical protein
MSTISTCTTACDAGHHDQLQVHRVQACRGSHKQSSSHHEGLSGGLDNGAGLCSYVASGTWIGPEPLPYFTHYAIGLLSGAPGGSLLTF